MLLRNRVSAAVCVGLLLTVACFVWLSYVRRPAEPQNKRCLAWGVWVCKQAHMARGRGTLRFAESLLRKHASSKIHSLSVSVFLRAG